MISISARLMRDNPIEIYKSADKDKHTSKHLKLARRAAYSAPATKQLHLSTLAKEIKLRDLHSATKCELNSLIGSINKSRCLTRLDLKQCGLKPEQLKYLLENIDNSAIKELDISFNNLTPTTMVKLHLSGLEKLNLAGNEIGDKGAKLLARAHLKHLKEIDLSDNKIQCEGLNSILLAPMSKKLQVLKISNNGISKPGIEVLANSALFKNLIVLDISYNFITRAGAEAITTQDPPSNLQRLNMAMCGAGIHGVAKIAQSPVAQSLVNWNISNNLCSDQMLEGIAGSIYLNNLTTLDLSGNFITALGIRSLGEARSLSLGALSHLHVNGAKLDNDAVNALATGPLFPQLSALYLSKNNLDFRHNNLLAVVLREHLVTLDLSYNKVGDKAWGNFAIYNGLANNFNLENLLLNGASLKDLGLSQFANLACFDKLRTLQLDGNKIGDDGFTALIDKRENFPNIDTFSIENNHIGKLGFDRLSRRGLNNVRMLYLGGNKMGDEGLALFAWGSTKNRFNSLAGLRLSKNCITKRGFESFFATACLPKLHKISFADNHLYNESLYAVAPMDISQRMSDLEELDLGSHTFGVDAITYFAKGVVCAGLREIDLVDCGLFEDDMREVNAELGEAHRAKPLTLSI